MNPKYRALIWEQSRVNGVLMLWYLITGVLLLILFRYEDVIAKDFRTWAGIAVHGSAIFFALTSVLRQNVHGHLVADFEPRLARLPVNTFALVTIPFAARLLYLLLLCVLLSTAYLVLNGAPLPWTWMLLPLEIYVAAQALAWSHRSITGLAEILAALTLFGPAIVHIAGITTTGVADSYEVLTASLRNPVAFATVLVAAYGVALLGVHLERRDERYGLPAFTEIQEWLVTRGASPDKPFVSPLAAQQWFERRAHGWVLPLGTFLGFIVLGLAIATAVSSAEPGEADTSFMFQFLPFAVLGVAAMAAGFTGLGRAHPFCLVRPAESRVFGFAKLLAQGRALALTLFAALAVSVLAFWALSTYDFDLLRNAVRLGHATWLDVAAVILGPFFIAAVAGWFLLNFGNPSIVVLPFLLFISAIGLALSEEYLGVPARDEEIPGLVFWGVTLYMLLVPPFVFLRATRRAVVSPRVWTIALPLWIAIGGLLWLYSAVERPSLALFLFHLGLAGMLLIPLAAVPLRIARTRHG